MLYDPRILVLDEATSNIDAEAERSIQQALEVLIKGRTTVAIAHRLSTLRNADRILVFDRGALAEQGSPAELLASDGIYARLVRMQTQVTKTPTVDHLIAAEKDPTLEATHVGESLRDSRESRRDSPTRERKSFIDWLDAQTTTFRRDRMVNWKRGAMTSV